MKSWKKLLVSAIALSALTSLAACGSSDKASGGSATKSSDASVEEILDKKQTIDLWSFTTVEPQIEYLKKALPNVTIKETVIPYADFQTKLDQVLGTEDGPDMIALDAGFAKKYIESGTMTDLNAYDIDGLKKDLFDYTVKLGENAKGEQAALSYQASPGAYYYNTELFEKTLGIAPDDVEGAQKALGSWDAIKDTAKTIKEKSGGKEYLFSSLADIYEAVIGGRKEGWVKDNKLVLDPTLLDSLDYMKEFVDNKWTKNTAGQSDQWFVGMQDGTIGAYGLPSWGLFYWLKDYTTDAASKTANKWHVTEGPVSYSWGGTWLGGVKGSDNAEGGSALSIYWSTNKAINEWDVKENSDFVALKAVNEELGKDAKVEILGEQNPYPVFTKAADGINGDTKTEYDQSIQSLWIDNVVNPYANGKVSKDKALDTFRNNVKAAFPELETAE
jgi:ABC-type glycerol-3-phosphate transport system substrate-binding protein